MQSTDRDYSNSGIVVTSYASRVGGCGLIPGRNRPKSLKLGVVAFPLGAQDYGCSTKTGPPVRISTG